MKTILIAEDEKALRNILVDKLSNEEYLILEAKDGVEALEMLKNNQVDLLLLDIMMPGISGVQVAQQVQESDDIDPKPKVIVLSNKDDIETVSEAVSAKAFTYLVKSDNSLEKITELIKEKLAN